VSSPKPEPVQTEETATEQEPIAVTTSGGVTIVNAKVLLSKESVKKDIEELSRRAFGARVPSK